MLSAYSASKFAVRGLTQNAGLSLTFKEFFILSTYSYFEATELGKYGITVNAYAPG